MFKFGDNLSTCKLQQEAVLPSACRVPKSNVTQIGADFDDLEGQIQRMLANYPETTLVVSGDFNCCLRKENSSHKRRLIEMSNFYNLRIINSVLPTYRPANSLLE